MRALQALVIVMGVLIVVGLALVAYGIATRVGGPGAVPASAPVAETAAASFGNVDLALPPGARVMDMAATGGRLVLRIEGRDGRQRLYLLDPSTGALVGTIALMPAP